MIGGSIARRALNGSVIIQPIAIAPKIKYRMLRYFNRANGFLTRRRDLTGLWLVGRRELVRCLGRAVFFSENPAFCRGCLRVSTASRQRFVRYFSDWENHREMSPTENETALGRLGGIWRRRRSTCITVVCYQTRRISL